MKPSLLASRKAKICSGCGTPPLGGAGGAFCAMTAGESRRADKTANDFSMNDPLNYGMSLMVSAN
jgi:hypothetical protein